MKTIIVVMLLCFCACGAPLPEELPGFDAGSIDTIVDGGMDAGDVSKVPPLKCSQRAPQCCVNDGGVLPPECGQP